MSTGKQSQFLTQGTHLSGAREYWHLLLVVLLLGLLASRVQAEDVIFTSTTPIRAKPDMTALPVATVHANEAARILRNKGFWVEVKTGQTVGWVKLNAFTFPAENISANSSPLAGVASGRVVLDPNR